MRPVVVDYRPEWPAEYDAIAARLDGALAGLGTRVDHVGSTAVPGLAAKAVIDVQVGVPSLEVAGAVVERLRALAYEPRPFDRDHRPAGDTQPESAWRKRFLAGPPGERATNTHVRAVGAANWRYALLFRDYLRAHPVAAAAYGELKRRLAPLCADTGVYADAKDPACDLIWLAAGDWAGPAGWQVDRAYT